LKAWELERTVKKILRTYTRDKIFDEMEPILVRHSPFNHNDYSDVFPQDIILNGDYKNLMLASGIVEGKKHNYILLVAYNYSDRPLS
jgi:hypothetical protein